MASIDTGSSGKKKGQPNNVNLRVDFTPMVDMNMLLITFFMFCTTLATPQIMDIVMPTRDVPPEGGVEHSDKHTITLILGDNDQIFYYEGKLTYDDPLLLKLTNADGLRNILLNRNEQAIAAVRELKIKRKKNEVSEAEFKVQLSALKKDKKISNELVIIKPTENSTYDNLVNILDEMQICSINMYAIVDLTPGDRYLLESYDKNNSLAQANLK